MSNQSSLFTIIIFILALPVAFGLIWTAVSLLISLFSGWGQLAKYYRTDNIPAGKSLGNYWLLMGPANYRGVTTIQPSSEGLYLSILLLFRLGHPPLLIPWRDIRVSGSVRSGQVNWITLEVGSPPITTLRLPGSETINAMVRARMPGTDMALYN